MRIESEVLLQNTVNQMLIFTQAVYTLIDRGQAVTSDTDLRTRTLHSQNLGRAQGPPGWVMAEAGPDMAAAAFTSAACRADSRLSAPASTARVFAMFFTFPWLTISLTKSCSVINKSMLSPRDVRSRSIGCI